MTKSRNEAQRLSNDLHQFAKLRRSRQGIGVNLSIYRTYRHTISVYKKVNRAAAPRYIRLVAWALHFLIEPKCEGPTASLLVHNFSKVQRQMYPLKIL